MKVIEYRELSPKEQEWAEEQKAKRSPSEKVAFMMLPESMRVHVEKNPPIAFKDYWLAYYPDIFLREERICIEIDGGYHEGRIVLDQKKDAVFENHGFTIIRIVNRDTEVNTSFWQRLIEGLEKGIGKHPEIPAFINTLQKMVDRTIRSWTDLDSNPHIYSEDSFYRQMENLMLLQRKCRVKRKKEKKTYPYYFY